MMRAEMDFCESRPLGEHFSTSARPSVGHGNLLMGASIVTAFERLFPINLRLLARTIQHGNASDISKTRVVD